MTMARCIFSVAPTGYQDRPYFNRNGMPEQKIPKWMGGNLQFHLDTVIIEYHGMLLTSYHVIIIYFQRTGGQLREMESKRGSRARCIHWKHVIPRSAIYDLLRSANTALQLDLLSLFVWDPVNQERREVTKALIWELVRCECVVKLLEQLVPRSNWPTEGS